MLHFSKVPYGDVMGKTLVFAVFDFDRFTKNDEIGEVINRNVSCWKKFRLKDKNILKVRVPVVNIDLAYPEEQWQQIKSTSGDGHVSLTLHILIFEY